MRLQSSFKGLIMVFLLLSAAVLWGQTVEVTSPNGGEIWLIGSSHDITWSTAGGVGNVRIEYSSNNGGNWSEIVADTANDGTYPWTTPNTSSNQFLVRVSETDGDPTDTSNGVFTVSEGIYGRVTDSSNTGIPAVRVRLYDSNNVQVKTCLTNSNGDYTLTQVTPANYKIRFDTANVAGNFISEYFNDKFSILAADIIAVSTNQSTNVDTVLSPGGIISGRVADTGDNGIANVRVQLKNAYSNAQYNTKSTDTNGNYVIQGLPSGDYKIFFNTDSTFDSFIAEWYNDKQDFLTADIITITGSQTVPNVDAVLAEGGTITGRITDDTSGAGIPEIEIYALDANKDTIDCYTFTDENGDYELKGLPTGDLKINFNTYYYNVAYTANYADQWFDNKSRFQDADFLSVTAGGTLSGINAALHSNGGIIQGRVTDESGNGIADITVLVIANWGEFTGWEGYTDADGYYQVTGIVSGTYNVLFLATSPNGNYLDEAYNDKILNGGTDMAGDWIDLTTGQTLDHIDAVLSPGGYVSGRVTDSSGNGIPNVRVRFYEASTGNYFSRHNALTDYHGYYLLRHCRPGQMKAYFQDYEAGGGQHQAVFYSGKNTIGDADAFLVQANQTTSGIDVVMNTGGGMISGYVRDSSGNPLRDASLMLFDTQNSYTFLGQVQSNVNGYFEFKSVIPGNYTLNASCHNYFTPEWYSNKANFIDSTVVTVTEGGNTQVEINLGETLSLTVTSPNGGEAWVAGGVYPITWTNTGPVGQVRLEYSTNNGSTWTEIAASAPNTGTYDWTVPGLSTSVNCRVRVSETDGEPSDTSDAVFCILSGGTGGVSGRVTNEGGDPIQGVNARAYDMNNTLRLSVYTDANGNYTLAGINPGNWKIYFRTTGSSSSYIAEWYDNKTDFNTANTVLVAGGAITPGINAVLSVGGSISGQVTNGVGVGIAGVQVSARDTANVQVLLRTTDSNGNYTIQGLPTGSYKVYFNTVYVTSGSFCPEWYSDKADFASADPVAVTAGQTQAGVDAVLNTGGSISGRITDADTGNPVADMEVDAYYLNGDHTGAYVYTDANGDYVLNGLSTGSYKLLFYTIDYNDANNTNYKTEWYNDRDNFYVAGTVGVTVGNTTAGIDAALAQNGGIITGRVTDSLGNGIGNVMVDTFAGEWVNLSWYYALSDANGNYRLAGLPADDYIVGFFPKGRGTNHVMELYDDVHNDTDATRVHVGTGQTVSGIDAVLDLGGTISGRVTNESGTGLKDVRVRIFSADTKEYYNNHNVMTDRNGYYTLTNVHPGQVLVFFAANEIIGGNYLSEFYNDKSAIETADALDVAPGGFYPNINAVLAQGGGTLALTVQTPDGSPIPNAIIQLYHTQYPQAMMYYNYNMPTDGNGYCEFKGLIPGIYKVFTTYWCIYPSEWHLDKFSEASADAVTITDGQTTPLLVILGDSGSLELTAPNGGEVWVYGENREITWNTTGNPANVRLEYSTDNGANWNMIAESAANIGHYTWTIPQCSSTDCLVRITEIDGNPTDTGNAVFSIFFNPAGWVPIEGPQYNMIAYGKAFRGNDYVPAGDWVGAFGPGGLADCRGAATVGDNGDYYLTIRGNLTAGETITFKLWPLPSGPDINAAETISFIADELYAGLPLHFGARNQEFPLVNGWNWISFNLLPGNTSFNSVFANILGKVEQIKSQTQAVIYTGGNWVGDLADMSGISSGLMYKVKTTQGCTFNVSGNTVPFNQALPLIANWNWTAYLPTLPQPTEDAVATIFDQLSQIKGQTQSAVKVGSGLIGDLVQLDPNNGYTIKLNAQDTLVYPHGQQGTQDLTGGTPAATDVVHQETTELPWVPITGNQYNMVTYGNIYFEGKTVDADGFYLVSRGPGGEKDCRSIGPVQTDGSYFATIRGNTNDETITFALFHPEQKRTFYIKESTPFQSDNLKGNFNLDVFRLKITAPAGGETLHVGETLNIAWQAYEVENVKIELLKDNRSLMTIVSSIPAGTNSYAWVIPDRLNAGGNYCIRVSGADPGIMAEDNSGIFSILPAVGIVLNVPVGGEVWQVNRSYDITWGASGIGTIKIELFKGAPLHTTITESTPNDGKYTWKVPGTQTLAGDYKIKVTAADPGVTASDMSRGPFTITAYKNTPADFDGDGQTDILWRYYGSGGYNCLWLTTNGAGASSSGNLAAVIDDPRNDPLALEIQAEPNTDNEIVGDGDFNTDGQTDILWRNKTSGDNFAWTMNGTTVSGTVVLPSQADVNWKICGTGDFNGDNKVDIVWRHLGDGSNRIWLMNGVTLSQEVTLTAEADLDWGIYGAGDFNRDGKADILWRNRTTGQNRVWLMNGVTLTRAETLPATSDIDWEIAGVCDYNGDGKADITWRNKGDGKAVIWLMDDLAKESVCELTQVTDTSWKIEN